MRCPRPSLGCEGWGVSKRVFNGGEETTSWTPILLFNGSVCILSKAAVQGSLLLWFVASRGGWLEFVMPPLFHSFCVTRSFWATPASFAIPENAFPLCSLNGSQLPSGSVCCLFFVNKFVCNFCALFAHFMVKCVCEKHPKRTLTLKNCTLNRKNTVSKP